MTKGREISAFLYIRHQIGQDICEVMKMNEKSDKKKNEPLEIPEKKPQKPKKTRKYPDGDEVPYIGEYDVPNPPVPNRAHTDM